MATISDILRNAIADSGMTMYRIAKDAAVDFSTVSRFCNGERTITLETADKLSECLGLELRPREVPARKRRRK